MKIEVATAKGKRTVEAEAVFGPLAIHEGGRIPVENLDDDEEIYVPVLTITHVPTGLRLWPGVYRQFAIRLAPLLAQLPDWDFERPDDMPSSLPGRSQDILWNLMNEFLNSADPEERRIADIQARIIESKAS